MLIIWSTTEGAIKQNYFDSLAKDICITYGFQELKRMDNMISEGLINVGTGSMFSGMNKSKFNTLVQVSDTEIENFNFSIEFEIA
jgi:hypothetical protein